MVTTPEEARRRRIGEQDFAIEPDSLNRDRLDGGDTTSTNLEGDQRG